MFENIIGTQVNITIDRPLGSSHPKFSDLIYPVNYGYVEGVIAGDGKEQDVYLLGFTTPLKSVSATVIAIIHRKNDVENKWVAAPKGVYFSIEEIIEATYFQEKYFDVSIYI